MTAARRALTPDELRTIVVAEARRINRDLDVTPESLVLLGDRTRWMATLRPKGPRIDEAHFAAVSEASLRLAGQYELARPVTGAANA